MTRGLLENEPEMAGLITEFLLTKGAEFTVDRYADAIETNWEEFSEYSFIRQDSFYLFWIIKTSIEAGEFFDMEDSYNVESFMNALLNDRSFDKLRKSVRSKRIHNILDLTYRGWCSPSLTILDSVAKYHYAPPVKRNGLKQYIDYCVNRRHASVEIIELDYEHVLDQINIEDYDVVIIDACYEDECIKKVMTLGFKHVIEVF